MFAPKHHSLSPVLAGVRRKLGFATIFNNLGPLCNPAGAPHQVIGVYDCALVEKTADALVRLGTRRSLVVHGEEGLDEISISGRTFVAEVDGESIRTFDISPADFGVDAVNTNGIPVSSPEESAALIRQILEGRRKGESAEKLVLVNAAAPIYLAAAENNFADAYLRAKESLRSGAALSKLNELAAELK
jgi:anthranilate phosphoribosyltransferase